MKKILEQFYIYLENKQYSIHTINSYKKDLNQFMLFCNNIKIQNIDYKLIRNYLEFIHNKNYSQRSINRHISY